MERRNEMLITTGMLELDASRKDRALFTARVRQGFGPAYEEFAEGLKSGSLNSSSRKGYKERINEHLFNFLKDQYRLPASLTPETFYTNTGKTAIGAVTHLAEITGVSISSDPIADEIRPNSPSPVDDAYYLALEEDGLLSDHLGFNIRRHEVLRWIAEEGEANSGNGAIREMWSEVQFVLNDKLYQEGSKGYKKPYTVFSRHDGSTNEFLGYADDLNVTRPDIRILVHDFTSRVIPGVGQVYTIGREKDPVEAALKAIRKAPKYGGIIGPELVEDLMGLKAVVLEGDLPKEQRKEGLVGEVLEAYLRVINQSINVRDVVEDHETNGDEGQVPITQKRVKIFPDNLSTPIELIVVREQHHLDQIYHIGNLDANGFHKGQAHELYEIKREVQTAKMLLPKSLSGIDTTAALSRRDQDKAEELKIRNDAGTNGRLDEFIKYLDAKRF